jgi:hypothetical protein
MTPENTYVRPDGKGKDCRTCRRIRNREHERRSGRDYGKSSYQKRAAKYRHDALQAYGGKCACCGELEEAFLVIDHINDDGADFRRSLRGRGGGGYYTYLWLKNNNYPDGFQVLCANCNMAKSRPGGCPHVTQ